MRDYCFPDKGNELSREVAAENKFWNDVHCETAHDNARISELKCTEEPQQRAVRARGVASVQPVEAKGQPWRRQYGGVAPAAQNIVPVESQTGADPNVNGNGPCPWRQDFGVSGQGSFNSPEVPSWKEFIQNQPPPESAQPASPVEQPSGPQGDNAAGNLDHSARSDFAPDYRSPQGAIEGASPVGEKQRAIIEESLRSKTSVEGFLYTGGFAGAATRGAIYWLDSNLLSAGKDKQGRLLELWQPYSPAHKALEHHVARAQLCRDGFAEAESAMRMAQNKLEALRDVPEKLLGLAQQKAASMKPPSAGTLLLEESRARFLQELETITEPADVQRVLGSRVHDGSNGILFERSSHMGRRLTEYANALRNNTSPLPSFSSDALARALKLENLRTTARNFETLEKQIQFLNAGKAGSPLAVQESIGTTAEVNAGEKLFIQGAAETEQLLSYATRAGAHADATQAFDSARAAMNGSELALEAARKSGARLAHGPVWQSLSGGLCRGLLTSAGVLALGYVADNALAPATGGRPRQDGMGRFFLDGVVVPSLLLSGMEPRHKIPAAALAFGTARVVDAITGTAPSVEMSWFLRPNWCDAIGATTTMLAPISPKSKVVGLAATCVIGRVYDALTHVTGLDGSEGRSLNDATKFLRDKDSIAQTVDSFETAALKAKELGIENPAALELQTQDQINRRNQHPVEYERANALLAYGLGMARLDKGSRLSVAHRDENSYFLKGRNYDFNCTAAEQFNSAVKSLETAEKYVWSHRGEVMSGGKQIDANYAAQLEILRSKVLEKSSTIYGEHDMEAVYSVIKDKCRTDQQNLLQFTREGVEKLGLLGETLTTSDRRYAAKMCRDLTLAVLAYAETCVQAHNGEDARSFFDAAERHLQNAQALEDSPNNRKLRELLDRVRANIPGAVQQQWQNPFNDPFNLRRK